MEVENSSCGITEAGNHLDQILKAFILSRAGIDSQHPKFINIAYDLERDIRDYKESLFNTGSVFVTLRTGESFDVSLLDFLEHGAVQDFKSSLHSTMARVLASVDSSFIDWVRGNPQRALTVVLTGGGATLPMARSLATDSVTVNGTSIRVTPAVSFPIWLRDDYPDLEQHYSRVAVSLGGARKNVIQSNGIARITAGGIGGHVLGRFPTRGV
jgi:molecular chaperone HscA